VFAALALFCFTNALDGKRSVRGGYAWDVNDQQLQQNIETLVAEEHALFDKGSALSADDRRRLGEVNVQLDRLWDLLRQRRAREEFGQDPGHSGERPAEVVEHYLQ
jgi:hypothetical protein